MNLSSIAGPLPSITGATNWAVIVLTIAILGADRTTIAQQSTELEQKRNDDSELLDGLRERRLFDVAEFYCRDQLAQPTIDETSQSTLIVELMKIQTTMAILSTAESRAEAWDAVEATSTDFDRTFPDHPRKILVQIQQALSHLSHGRLLRQEIDAEMATNTARLEALAEIRIARSLFGNLQREISNAIPDQRGRTLTAHELTSEQLLHLVKNVQYQLAVCDLNRAQLYKPSERLNRIDALNGVSQKLIEVQRSVSDGEPLWWKTKLGQIECLRLLGDSTEARALADSLTRKTTPYSTRVLLLEQKARVAIELGNEKYSQSVLTEFNQLNTRSAELELAIVKLAADLAARASTEARKQEWISFAAELSKSIQQTHGEYWGRRADLVLISATGVANNGTGSSKPVTNTNSNQPPTNASNNVELNLLVRLADEAERKERWDDALKAYDRAAKFALSLNEPDQALRLEYRAGKILENQGKHRLAAQRLTSIAIRDGRLSLAPSVHLVGCWNFAKAIQNDQPDQRKQFQELLLDHLRRWPSGTNADQVRIWLAGEFQASQKWNEAFDVFILIGNDSPHLTKAIEGAIACANRVLLTLKQANLSTKSMAARMVEQLTQKLRSLQASSSAAARLILACADLDLSFGTRQPNPSLVPTLIPIETATDTTLANAAKAIHAATISLVEAEKAKQLVSQIGKDERALGQCERCLNAMTENPALGARLKNAQELRLEVIELALKIPEMQQPSNSVNKTRWMMKKADALSAVNRYSESIAVLKELEKQYPRNAGVKMQLARAMSIQFEKTDPTIPLDKWRRIAAQLTSHSANWYEAKYEVARLLIESGDSTAATKLLKYIQAIPPGWENSLLKSKFEQLLRRSEGE